MKKIISIALAGLMTASALASCAPKADRLDDAITLASSDAAECANWLDGRLDSFPTEVIVGVGSNDAYGIDMSDFEEDGYILRSLGNDTLVFGASAEGLDRAVRAYAKAADAGAAETLDETYHEGARIKNLTIANRNISEFTVVYNYDRDAKNIANEAPTFGNTQFAAEQFVRLVEIATGITLNAVPHTEKVSEPVIFIDYYTDGDLGENGFTYKVENGNLYINGVGRANGCANAVYYLFDHECGWDGLLIGDSILQETDHVDIPEGLSKRVDPMFDFVIPGQLFVYEESEYDTDKDEFSTYYWGSVPKAYHEIGEISGKHSNICPNDDGVFMDVLDNVLLYIESHIAAGQVIGEDFANIGLGMEDSTSFCKCKECAVMFREEGKALSGGQVYFANRLSDAIRDEGYEGMNYSIYSYAGSNKPCKTAPNDNVYVTYCVNGHCQNHKLDGSECTGESCLDMSNVMKRHYGWSSGEVINNSHFAEWAKGWAELTDHVYVYSYMLSYNFSQFTNMRNLYDDVHFFYDIGFEGFYYDGGFRGLGLHRLHYQMIYDICFHPEMTEAEYEVRLNEIMRREYGEGYEFVKSYINLWEQTEVNTGCWYGWMMGRLINPGSCDTAMYAEYAPQMTYLLEEALKLCDTAAQESSVKRLMCDVFYRECAYKYFPAYDAGDTETIAYLEKRYDFVVEVLEEHGFVFETTSHAYYSFGPCYAVAYGNSMQDTLVDAMWIDLQRYRDELTPEGTTQRPVPDGYEVYVKPE